MLLSWVTAEEASCPTRKYLESYDQQPEDSKKSIDTHLARPHILIPSLPSPSEALEIPLPPNVKRKTTHLNIQNIANLWMQLLSIQTQNGGFIRHDKWHQPERTKCCISQMTEDECAEIYRSFKDATRPVEEAVADLICSLPYASCNDECYKIAPSTMMPDPTSERDLYLGGPTIPPHLMRLTDWWGGTSGMLILIDVLNGDATELKDYKPNYDDGDCRGKVMTEYNGPRKPAQQLLQEWIDNFLNLRWIPDGGMDIIQAEWRNMVFLDYKSLFQELNWPHAFPLSPPQMDLFLKRHHDLKEKDRSAEQRLRNLWYSLSRKGDRNRRTRRTANPPPSEQTPTSDPQRLRILDQKIREALSYHGEREMEIAYAAATNSEIESRLKSPVRLHDSANMGHDWRVDVTAHEIMERFNEVVARAAEPNLRSEERVSDDDLSEEKDLPRVNARNLAEMKAVMEAAYRRYLDPREADREARMVGVPDEDDDSTGDFMDGEEIGGGNGDGESSSDTMDYEDDFGSEAEDDLDAEALRRDMEEDIEVVRGQLAGMKPGV